MKIETIEISKINPAVYNPRKDLKTGDPEYEHLKKSINEFGLIDPLIWNKRTGNLVGGHQRLKILKERGDKEVEVSVVDFDDAKEKALNIALNKISGDWDMPLLKDLLEELDTGDFDMDLTGFTSKEIEDLMTQFHTPEEGLTDDDAVPENVETICKKGDLWKLGEHRLLCGDSTVITDVERLMQGEKAGLIWTDPPYGVNYGDKIEKANPIAHRVRTIENDNLTPANLEEFLRTAFSNASLVSDNGCAIYVACPAGTLLPFLIASFNGSGFDFRWQLIWLKDQIVLSRADYHFKHENILYGWKSGETHYFTEDRKQSSVFECARPKSSPEHPTMKPVELIERMLTNSSKVGWIVLDLFGGSGSTLIACEKLNRKCRMMEIDEHYCDVIIKRWEDFTGKKAELIKG
jgi:DNA modification methylase